MGVKEKTGNNYLKTKVLTATAEELQLMLYDGAIRFCEQARQAIQNKDVEKSFHLLTRAENILLELCNGMRDEIAPETCTNMRRLYLFCYERLVAANMKRKEKPIEEALQVLRHMRETWTLLMNKLKEEKAGGQKEISAAYDDMNQALEAVGSKISLEG